MVSKAKDEESKSKVDDMTHYLQYNLFLINEEALPFTFSFMNFSL